jgi:hypothetical protein
LHAAKKHPIRGKKKKDQQDSSIIVTHSQNATPKVPLFHQLWDTKSSACFCYEVWRITGRQTLVLGANRAIRAAAALPALFSSMKLIVELITNKTMIPRKSCQSGGFPYIPHRKKAHNVIHCLEL